MKGGQKLKKVLLGMDDGIAQIFRSTFAANTQEMTILKQNIPIFHNLKQAIIHFKPDIVFLSMGRLKFDSDNHKTELLRTIFNIKTNGFNQLRFVVQTDLPKTDPFLRSLVAIGIYDIFPSDHLDMQKVINQLEQPVNMRNVTSYLIGKPLKPLNLGLADQKQPSMKEQQNQVATLQAANQALKADNRRLRDQVDQQSVPREDYDALLKQVHTITESGLDDEKAKRLFAKIIDTNHRNRLEIVKLRQKLSQRTQELNNLAHEGQQIRHYESHVGLPKGTKLCSYSSKPESQKLSPKSKKKRHFLLMSRSKVLN